MSSESQKQPWESKLREAATHVEDDVRKMVAYLNDEVMPDVRPNGSAALKKAATELQRLATRMDEANQPPPKP